MTNFTLVYPFSQTVRQAACADLDAALRLAGLQPGKVDHGVVAYDPETLVRLGIVVFEFSLFVPAREQKYFAIGKQMFGGNAVLYAEDSEGHLLNLDNPPLVQWLPGKDAIERNIELGLIDRPEVRVNNKVTWQWPQKETKP